MRTLTKFGAIDGAQRAAAFAYYALFSLFPVMVLFVSLGSFLFERKVAVEKVVQYAERYFPLEAEMKRGVFDTITGVVEARGQVGLAATLLLVWSSLQFFTALVRATNRAWNTDIHNWWQMPAKSLALLTVLGTAVLLGIVLPVAARLTQQWLPVEDWITNWATDTAIAAVPLFVLFYGLTLFYRLAPRRRTRFSEVWLAALLVAPLLWTVGMLFSLYLRNFAKFNVIYGAFGGIMALMMWIYLSGCIVILGSCLCASAAEGTK